LVGRRKEPGNRGQKGKDKRRIFLEKCYCGLGIEDIMFVRILEEVNDHGEI